MANLRAVVIMDYQNVHLTGYQVFPSPPLRLHDCLIHPLHYANRLLQARNANQKPGFAPATLAKVLVYRGLPSGNHDPDAYAWNLAHKAEWERDPRVRVVHRPLKYSYQRTASGQKASDAQGRLLVTGKAEKGIDVLCALALVREAMSANTDLAVLASQDTDLEPALEEAAKLGHAKVETASWFQPTAPHASKEIRSTSGYRVWNTRLNQNDFVAARDLTKY